MNDFSQGAQQLDAQVVAQLRRAVELGKYPDGRRLDAAERALCMQAIILWEGQHLQAEQRTGYIDRGSKAEGEVCASDHEPAADEQPVELRSTHHR